MTTNTYIVCMNACQVFAVINDDRRSQTTKELRTSTRTVLMVWQVYGPTFAGRFMIKYNNVYNVINEIGHNF